MSCWENLLESNFLMAYILAYNTCSLYHCLWCLVGQVPDILRGSYTSLSIAVILNRGPHGPPGGNLQVLGRNTEQLGNWGGMDPFGGNQQIAIHSPGCSSGWRIVAASPVFVYVTLRPEDSSALPQTQTKMDTGPMKDNIFGADAFILLTKIEMHALPAQRISKFRSKFGSWCTWCPTPEKYPGLHPPLLAGWGGIIN